MEPLPGIAHDDLLKLVLSVAVLLVVARLLGEVAQRLSLPAVVGEIVAGVVLGPSFLSALFPLVREWILPSTAVQANLLDLVGLIGVMLLMVVVGLETDLGLIRARAATAVGVGLGGLFVPFLAGLALGAVLPGDLLATENRVIFSLFLAIAMALSAIPVLARVLIDLDLMRRDFGQTMLAAGMIDDIVGWTLLGLATALAGADALDAGAVVTTVGAVVLFFAATAVIARPLARRGLALVQDRMVSRDRLLTLVVVLAFAWGAFSHALHLEPILGAFVVGILFGQMRRLPVEVGRQLESVTFGVFAPVFLAIAGLRLELGSLLQPRLLLITVVVVLVATAGKVVGAYLGGRFIAGRGHWESIAYGAGLNARGVLGVIVAALGLSMGIISVEVYSMIVVMSVATSLMAPAAMRWAASHLTATGAEQARFADVRRVLVPVRPGSDATSPAQTLEAAVIARIAGGHPSAPAVTLLSVTSEDRDRPDTAAYLERLAELFPPGAEVSRRIVVADAPVPVILEEATKDYDLLVVGASEPGRAENALFNPVIDDLVRLAPCTTLVVRATDLVEPWPPGRILVPVDGKAGGRRAADIAFAIARSESKVVAMHVVSDEAMTLVGTSRSSAPGVRFEIGREIVEAVRTAGEPLGVDVVTHVVMGEEATGAILERARSDVDLIIVGTAVRPGSTRLFLGPKVERILDEAPCPVIVVNGV